MFHGFLKLQNSKEVNGINHSCQLFVIQDKKKLSHTKKFLFLFSQMIAKRKSQDMQIFKFSENKVFKSFDNTIKLRKTTFCLVTPFQ